MSILDLAVGWREGLQALSALWTWDATCTFWLAFLISDKESCHQILDSFFMPMNTFPFIRLMMDLVKADAMDWAQIVVKSHVRKRTDLATLGRQHLSPIDQKRLGLSTTQLIPLDAHAREVYDLLRDKGIQVPLALHPGWTGSIYYVLGAFSNYHYGSGLLRRELFRASPSGKARDSFLLVAVAQQLFDNGFAVIDKAQPLDMRYPFMLNQNEVETPLQRATCNFSGLIGLPLCLWLLQKGANPIFPLSVYDNEQDTLRHSYRTSSNLLVRLAKACRAHFDSHCYLVRLLVQYASGLCPSMSTDSCVCYCLTSDGCLPQQHLQGFRDVDSYMCNGHERTGNALVSWLESCHLTHDDKSLCFEQAVRLELFDRLGLVHTCCRGNVAGNPKDVERIRDDDEELASQLDLLMSAYRGSILMFLQQHHEDEEYSTEFDCGCHDREGLEKQLITWGSHNLDGHTTRLLAHWRQWWSLTDPILTDIYGLSLDDTDMVLYRRACRTNHQRTDWRDVRRVIADMRTGEKLDKLGFGNLDYKEVIERHFATELTYAKENIISVPRGSEDAHYWQKKFDKATFVPVRRTELLDELMEKLKRALSGRDEMFIKETEIWSGYQWW